MNEQYELTNQCLLLLEQSEMPSIEKLQIEIQLIKMKRLLLNENIPSEVKHRVCGERVFQELLCQIRGICQGSCEENPFVHLSDRIGGMLTTLGGHAISLASVAPKSETAK